MRLSHLLLLLATFNAASCTPGFEGEYSDPAKQEIVDDKWNETDAHKTAEKMIAGMLAGAWLKEFHQGEKKRPVIVLSDVENRTDEHLDVKTLTEFIRDEMIKSQQVKFVSKKLRNKILEELEYQQGGSVNKNTAKKRGQHVGADFILSGSVSSQVHTQGEKRTVSYFTNLTLTSIETTIIEWSEKYEIKKTFRRSGSGW